MDNDNAIKASCTATLKELCEEKVHELFEIWSTIGHRNLDSRADVICKNVEQLLKDMVDEETESQDNLVKEIEILLKEAADLSQEVGAKYNELIAGLDDKTIPLLQVQSLLNDRLRDCRECKQQRVNAYQELLDKEHQLCLSIGLKKRPKFTSLPKEEDLLEFKNYIDKKLEEERELRLLFEDTKNKIQTISSELGISPDTSVHKMVVSDQQMCLSSHNMLLLKELHQDMEHRLEKAKSESIELREKLSNLWERLHVEYEVRDVFLLQYPGYSKKSMDALKAEIQKYEEKKRQNIRVFVEAIREELKDWWDKCCVGKEQRQQFCSFNSDFYTEDLLDLHELEVEKLKKYFMDNIGILELAKKREKLWKKMMELDERAHDPRRLFGNRGGQLLREEKERKCIQKDLPNIDKELNHLLDAYEDQHQSPFFYDGNNLRDVIKSKWDDFQKKKEEEKLARKKGKDHIVTDKTLSATKRKLPRTNTPASVPAKVTKTATTPTPGGSGVRNAVNRNLVVRKILDKRDNRENIVMTRSKLPKPHGLHSPEASYSEFEVGLEKLSADMEMVRSSVVPSRLLRERNGRLELSNIKERVATPVKPPRKNSVTRSCTNLSEFRTPQAPKHVSPGLSRSRSAPRLAAVRGRLPIII